MCLIYFMTTIKLKVSLLIDSGYLTRPFPSFVTCYAEFSTVGAFPRKALTESRFLDEWLAAKFWRCRRRFSRRAG